MKITVVIIETFKGSNLAHQMKNTQKINDLHFNHSSKSAQHPTIKDIDRG